MTALGAFQTPNAAAAAPDTVYFNEVGTERRLTDLRGRGIVVNSGPLVRAMCTRRTVDRLKGLVSGNGIDVLAISQDRQGASVVKKFYATNKLHDLEILIDKGSN